jgi:hypothetical protein
MILRWLGKISLLDRNGVALGEGGSEASRASHGGPTV